MGRMSDTQTIFDTTLDGLNWHGWSEAMEKTDPEDGFVEPLGPDHTAIFLENKPVLLVSFESLGQVQRVSPEARPMGWEIAKALGWSSLALVSNGDTWFRDRRVIGFFDRLIDDGFFEDFDKVIFYGCGPSGYAACAFSVAAPGAEVLALHPQATLDPRLAEWDDRFREKRRTDFTSRFGYAPDMLDAAEKAYVFYDPEVDLDAMHAALFNRANVRLVKTRHMGSELDVAFRRMNVIYRLLAHISAGKLTDLNIARLMRARREFTGYQFNLLQHLTAAGRHGLTIRLCDFVTPKRRARPFVAARQEARAALQAQAEAAEAGPGTEMDPSQSREAAG
jgi:hypothetical protein